MIGGYVISVVGSTAMTFRYFGVAAAVSGLLLFIYEFAYRKGLKAIFQSKQKKNKRQTNSNKDIKDNTNCTSEPLIKSKDILVVKVEPNKL